MRSMPLKAIVDGETNVGPDDEDGTGIGKSRIFLAKIARVVMKFI